MAAKYEMIYYELLNRIESGKIKPGQTLPGEFDLMDQFHASRDTIRKSLQLLAQNGYVQKSKGKGSIVLDIHRHDFPVSGVVSFKELSHTMGGQVETIVTCCECVEPDEQIKKVLSLKQDDKIWIVERVRRIDGESIILDTDFLNATIIPGVTKEIAENSLYEYVEKTLGLRIGYAKKEITCQNINGNDQKLLDLNGYDMVINVDSYTFLENTTIFQFTCSRHRPDKFRFNEFARRSAVAAL